MTVAPLLCALLVASHAPAGGFAGSHAGTRVRGDEQAVWAASGPARAPSPRTPWASPCTYGETAAGRANQYNGRVYDQGTGFHDYGARLYWPEIGRFVSADSYLGDPGNPASLNRYSYVHNNPYKYVDPTGHWPEWFDRARDSIRGAYEEAGRALTASLNPRQTARNDVEAEMASDSAQNARVIGSGLGDMAYGATEDAVASMAVVAGTKVAGAAGEVLSRFGTSRESAGRLARKAAEAEGKIGIHGVSTTARKVEGASSAARSEVEKVFKVHNTGSKPAAQNGRAA